MFSWDCEGSGFQLLNQRANWDSEKSQRQWAGPKIKLGKQDEQKVGDDGQDESTFFFFFF